MTTATAGGFYLHKQGTKRRRHATRASAEAAAERLVAGTGGVAIITQEVGRVAPPERSE